MDGNNTHLVRLKNRFWRKERPVIVILSGAGLSAESGIATFRDPSNGWVRTGALDARDYERDPKAVIEVVNRRIEAYDGARPNAAHEAIARFVKRNRLRADIVHITQNVDSLCEEAGDTSVFHLHGTFLQSRCTACGAVFPRLGPYSFEDVCPVCRATHGAVRTNVVFFGEIPYGMDWIPSVLKRADIFLAVGTSGFVYPAADFVRMAFKHGCRDRILLAKDVAENEQMLMCDMRVQEFNQVRRGLATQLVPRALRDIEEVIEQRDEAQAPD